MILFTPESAALILAGLKIQTRRLWLNKRCKVGSIHNAQLNLHPSSCFAELEIHEVEEWDGEYISGSDVIKEGFQYASLFWDTYTRLNAKRMEDPDRKHYYVNFKVHQMCKNCIEGSCEYHNLPTADEVIAQQHKEFYSGGYHEQNSFRH